MDQGSLSNPGVNLRDIIRREAQKATQNVDQVNLGVVSDAGDGKEVGVLLDGFAGGEIPATWATPVTAAAGLRVAVLNLKGGQSFYVVGVIDSGGGGGAVFPVGGTTGQALVKASDADSDVEWAGPHLKLSGGTMAGSIAMGNYNITGINSVVGGSGVNLAFQPASGFHAIFRDGAGTNRFIVSNQNVGDLTFYDKAGAAALMWDESANRWETDRAISLGGANLEDVGVVRNANGPLYLYSSPAGAAGDMRFYVSDVTGVDRLRMNWNTGGDFVFNDETGANVLLWDQSQDRWEFKKYVFFADGTATTPSISFESDNNTGIYWIAADQLGITAGSSTIARFIEGTYTGIMNGANATGGFFIARAAGTAAAPVYSFANDYGTGMYRSSAGVLGFSSEGDLSFVIGTAVVRGQSVADTFWMPHGAGTVSAPTYSFYGDSNLGFFRAGTDRVALAPSVTGPSGTAIIQQEHHGLMLLGGAMNATDKYTAGLLFGSTDPQLTTENPKLLAAITGVAVETYDGDTKGSMGIEFLGTPLVPGTSPNPVRMWRMTKAVDSLSRLHGQEDNDYIQNDPAGESWTMWLQGVNEFKLSTSGLLVPNVYSADFAGGSTVYCDSANGQLHVNTSARRTKTDITDASYLRDVKLQPVRYRKKGQDLLQYGLIADDLMEQDRRIGVYNEDGEITDYMDRAVLAVLAAKVEYLWGLIQESAA